MGDVTIEAPRERGAVRRAAELRCEAVSLERYALLGTRVLDISETGLLLATDALGACRELALVHLFDRDADVVVQAEVARVVHGRRPHDGGLALGLVLTRRGAAFRRLLKRLRGTPPPVPRRRMRRDYAAAVSAVFAG